MKFFTPLLFLLFVALYAACGTSAKSQANTSSSGQTQHAQQELKYAIGDDFILFYNKAGDAFYLVQTKKPAALSGSLHLSRYTEGRLIVETPDHKAFIFAIDDNAYGISKMEGKKFKRAFLQSNSDLFVPEIAKAIADVACGCFSMSEEKETPCKSGGKGSISCMHKVKPKGFQTATTVNCGQGYYSCCQ